MIYQLFLNALEANPLGHAINTSDGELITYAELNIRINQWVKFLYEQNIQAKERVAVLTADEDLHIFLYLALDRLNAVYVPFDMDTPSMEVTGAINALELKNIITDTDLHFSSAANTLNIIKLSALSIGPIDDQEIWNCPRPYHENSKELSYIVASSGSTGVHKYIPIQGAGLLYWQKELKKKLELDSTDSVIACRSPAYDARIWEYINAFSAASTLYLTTAHQRKDLQFLIEHACKNHIHCMTLIVSELDVKDIENILLKLKTAGLKHLMVTGDACSIRLKVLCEANGINLWNCYGPTEATFGITILKVNNKHVISDNGYPLMPIGVPLGEEVKIHLIEGELFIESEFLTPGYIVGDDQSIQIREIEGKPRRVFATGDNFSLEGDYLIYQGRAKFDAHCKINGVKVTPFRIESVINSYNQFKGEDILKAVVVIKKHLGKYKPYAYIIEHKKIDKNDFIDYIKANLKKEETPLFHKTDAFPRLLPSQKTDRNKLISQQDDNHNLLFKSHTFDIDSQDNHTKRIAEIWCELLNLDSIDPDEEFLYLGGDSLLAKEMLSLINQQFSINLSYLDLLQLKTVSISNIAKKLSSNIAIESSNHAIINRLFKKPTYDGNVFFLPALLGDGYTTYKTLADQLGKHLRKKIYGLTERGLYDISKLSKSLDESIQSYIAAIKSIQPEGPYYLLGFSYGSFSAYEVALALEENGDKVEELHLLDGFPPMLYQLLSNEDYSKLIETLFQFIIKTLNNNFYNENIAPIKMDVEAKLLDKETQVKNYCIKLEAELVNQASKNVLKVVEQHLTFILNSQLKLKKPNVCPTFYLSNRQQNYLSVIEKTKTYLTTGADKQYYFWNYYVKHIILSSVNVKLDHLDFLGTKKDFQGKSVEDFWVHANAIALTDKNTTVTLQPCYGSYQSVLGVPRIKIFFLTREAAIPIIQALEHDNINVNIRACDMHYPMLSTDIRYQELYNIDFLMNSQLEDKIGKLLQSIKIEKTFEHESRTEQPLIVIPENKKSYTTIDISLDINSKQLLTLSFLCYTNPEQLANMIFSTFQIQPQVNKNKDKLIYQHQLFLADGQEFISNEDNTVLISASYKSCYDFLILFMSLIEKQIIPLPPPELLQSERGQKLEVSSTELKFLALQDVPQADNPKKREYHSNKEEVNSISRYHINGKDPRQAKSSGWNSSEENLFHPGAIMSILALYGGFAPSNWIEPVELTSHWLGFGRKYANQCISENGVIDGFLFRFVTGMRSIQEEVKQLFPEINDYVCMLMKDENLLNQRTQAEISRFKLIDEIEEKFGRNIHIQPQYEIIDGESKAIDWQVEALHEFNELKSHTKFTGGGT